MPRPARRGISGCPASAGLHVDASPLVEADLRTVDALVRLALHARRAGVRVCLAGASSDLRGLIELTGLADVLPCEPNSGVESEG